MKTVVLKFGGTSVGSIDRIKKVCKIISSYKKKKNKVVVISSAMSGVTNELVNKSKLISNESMIPIDIDETPITNLCIDRNFDDCYN